MKTGKLKDKSTTEESLEGRVRELARNWIVEMVEEELEAALGAGRYVLKAECRDYRSL